MKMLLLFLIFISYTYATVDESTLTSLQTSEHWNTFRIVIPHTTDECFYLETKLNDTIHVIYQVLKGGDSTIRTIITDPLSNVLYARAGSPFGWYEEGHLEVPGTYQICFKNEQYFTTKLIYIGVLVVNIDLLMEAAVNTLKQNRRNNETAVVEEFSKTSMKSLRTISSTLYQLTAYQTIARVHHAHDMYSVEANASYVQKWAVYQMITMILCSIIQVFSIRRLFKSTISNKKSSYKKSNPTFHLQTSDYLIITN